MIITPLDYADRYRKMRVYFEEGSPVRVRVASYRIGWGDVRTKDNLWSKVKHYFKNNKELMVCVENVNRSVMLKTYRSKNELKFVVLNPFQGKGSPEQVQVMLQLAVKFKLLQRNNLDIYCKGNNIGLDCSGFIGNYLRYGTLRHRWDEPDNAGGIGPKSGSNAMFRRGKRIDDVGDLQAGTKYLLAWVNSNGIPRESGNQAHVVITMPFIPEAKMVTHAQEFHAVESTGRKGLVDSEYIINQQHKKRGHPTTYNVWRGSKGKKLLMGIATLPQGVNK